MIIGPECFVRKADSTSSPFHSLFVLAFYGGPDIHLFI